MDYDLLLTQGAKLILIIYFIVSAMCKMLAENF